MTPLLPQRPMGLHPTMVNDYGAQDVDAQFSGAHVQNSPLLHPDQNLMNDDNSVVAAEPAATATAITGPSPSTHPPVHQPQNSERTDFLTDLNPRSALPQFWLKLLHLPRVYQRQLQRMLTRGDGSCAKGALLLALMAPHPESDDLEFADIRPLSGLLANS